MELEVQDKISTCIKVAACICGKDGLISEVEEATIFKIVNETFPDFGDSRIEEALVEFFNSKMQIEDYLVHINDEIFREFTIFLSKRSASADGLNIDENIALQKAMIFYTENAND